MYNILFLITLLIIPFSTQYNNNKNSLSDIGENILLNSSSYEHLIFEKEIDSTRIKLIRRITKTKNQIISKNYLLINNNEKKEVEFNEIESIYNIDEKIIICPKGKYHPIEYYKNNLEEKIPLSFKENGNWNLKCYQSEVGKIQAYYLMNGKTIIYTITKNEYILEQHNKLFDEIYDFKTIKKDYFLFGLSAPTTQCYELCRTCSEKSTSETDQKCTSCISGFILDDNGNCVCKSGYYKVGTTCKACSNSCKTFIDNSCYCSSCETNYYIDPDNYCSKCPSSSIDCPNAICCSDCFNKYFWEEVTDQCLQCGMNCGTFEDDNCRCKDCNVGYYLSYHQCLPCNSNCKSCSGSGDHCLSCSDGYFLENNKCSACDKNCRTCDISGNNCTGCYENTFLYENECLDCATNCSHYEEDNCKCFTCNDKFEFINHQCKLCPGDTSICSHYENNKCNCETCIDGYYLENSSCQKCDDNCNTCSENSTRCTDCKENYFLNDKKCYECTDCNKTVVGSCKCESCNEGKFLNNGRCEDCNEACQTCIIEKDRCQSCKEGYYFYKLSCLACYERCKTCTSGGNDEANQHCQSCKDNYVFFEENCLEECPEKYYEVDKHCVLCNQLCKTAGVNCNDCTSCIDGYYLLQNEFKCQKCDEHCETCENGLSENNENCLTCNISSEFKYLVNATGFGKNCVSSCPSGTKLDGMSTCILVTPEENTGGSNALVISLSVVGGLLVAVLVVYLIIRFRRKKNNQIEIKINKNCNDTLINEINKDLHLYQSFT